jgi:hypothetical protein
MDYLVYIAHDAENLQFFLWLRDYTERFNALTESQQNLSPEWVPTVTPQLIAGNATTAKKLQKTVVELGVERDMTAFYDDTITAPPTHVRNSRVSFSPSEEAQKQAVVDANPQAGLKWQSSTIQPFRQEITLIITHYIATSSPRELNLSHKDRAALLHALQHTTHPSAFTDVLKMITLTLRNQSHPNFVRWSICNGNKPRVFFLRSFAIFWMVAGLIMSLLLVFSGQSRWWRIFVAPVWWFAFTNMVASYKGLCVLLFRQHTREVHPWEIITETTPLDPSKQTSFPVTSGVTPLYGSSRLSDATDVELGFGSRPTSSTSSLEDKLKAFGAANRFEHEPWVGKWSKHPKWRKLMLKKVHVQEEGLRIMQSKIVQQAELWALLCTIIAVTIVTALPQGAFY